MFGAKGPNSSQYDFKGTTVHLSSFRPNRLLLPTSPLLLVRVALVVELQADLSHKKEQASPTNLQTKPTNSRVPSTEMPSLPKTPTTLKKTSKS